MKKLTSPVTKTFFPKPKKLLPFPPSLLESRLLSFTEDLPFSFCCKYFSETRPAGSEALHLAKTSFCGNYIDMRVEKLAIEVVILAVIVMMALRGCPKVRRGSGVRASLPMNTSSLCNTTKEVHSWMISNVSLS